MGDIVDYFSSVEQLIARTPIIVSHEITYDVKSRALGLLSGRINFIHSMVLEFLELVKIDDLGNQESVKYRFHLMREDTTALFRYDNAPHHPEIDSFPDHKHLFSHGQERIVSSERMHLERVLREIEHYV